MAANSSSIARVLSEIPGIAGSARLADVGGGSGAILTGVLAANPHMQGLLFDTESGLRSAEATVSAAGVRERCDIVPGDFFESVPGGCDAYLLKHVVHNWSDGEAVTILRHCRENMPPDAVLYLVETVVPDDPAEFDAVTMIRDLNMLVLTGKERTRTDFEQLLAAAGLELAGVSPLAPPAHRFSLISASMA
jgi:orsellinic acid C2-O-methyltransferase